MNAWYLSYNRFEKRIIKRWNQRGFRWNNGHLALLPFAYRTVMFWARYKQPKVSQKNQTVGHPTLF